MSEQCLFGIEVLEQNPSIAKDWGNCLLLSNHASVNARFRPSADVCHRLLGNRLKGLLSPQHGYFGTEQDNMCESIDDVHPRYDLPIYSLYSEHRIPQDDILRGIDTILIDLQNVGCRVYTFKATVAACLRAAQKNGCRVIVLDRPNPLGGDWVEGRGVDDDSRSFVGEYSIPLRHGLTMGEAALFFNQSIGAEVEVVTVKNWRTDHNWSLIGRKWFPTSPNLPTLESVYMYPGMVLFEGTNVSEGRGTTLPFQLIGAPFINCEYDLAEKLISQVKDKTSLLIRPTQFKPTAHKWAGELCRGIHFSVLDPLALKSVGVALTLIKILSNSCPEFDWSLPPYEYEFERMPIQLLIGSEKSEMKLRKFDRRDSFWTDGLEDFQAKAFDIHLYPRSPAATTIGAYS